MLMIKCIDAADVLLAHTTMKFQPKTELLRLMHEFEKPRKGKI